jgi:hypothetical protein
LPVPHPLDFDWRFTNGTRSLILERINRVTAGNGRVVFLGAPTLFRTAQETPLGGRCFLIDACRESALAVPQAKQSRVIVADLLVDDIPNLSAMALMADPPWYEEFAQAFLWVANQIVELSGNVFLSTPPVGTRPGIEQEWSRTLVFAHHLGLVLRDVEQCLRYQSPPFEKNALRAAGHDDVHSEWRPGILARFEKVAVGAAVPRPSSPPQRGQWQARSLLGVRFYMRRMISGSDRNPIFKPVVHGDVLSTVSRRDVRRDAADVWTSGNRIFGCSDTETVTWIVDALDRGHRPDTYVEASLKRKLTATERELVLNAADQVVRIVARELAEYVLEWEG